MAAVVRVKRRLEDDPVESLVLLCKKVKRGADVDSASACQDDSSEAVKSVFKFAGTVSGPVSTWSYRHDYTIGTLDVLKGSEGL